MDSPMEEEEEEGRPRFFKVLVGDFARRLVRIPSSPDLGPSASLVLGVCMCATFLVSFLKGKNKANNALSCPTFSPSCDYPLEIYPAEILALCILLANVLSDRS